MSTNALRLLRGRVVDGRYLLDEWIGGGSFGGVFLAGEYVDDRRLRTVAVKLLPAEPGDAGEAQRRELEVSLNLDHPNLLRCFSAGRCGVEGFDVLYLTMEVAEGSLEARLQESLLSESETRELALSLASALSHLHAKNLVHRDVKPGNVLRVGDAWKLADFGSVRAVEKSTAQASKNIGTASYAPPEAYEGSVSSAWDVWSLGCLLQEAATGVLPFEADTPTALMHRVLTGDPAIPADLPDWLAALVRSCLNKERSQRPAARDVPEVASSLWSGGPAAREVSREFAVIVSEKLGIEPERVTWQFLAGLKVLDLGGTRVMDAGLAHLKGLIGLQDLGLRSTKVTDAGLAHLRGLTGLQSLDLSYTKVTDAGLEHLRGLTGLQRLDLSYTQVTDAGLEHLRGLTGLQRLDLRYTQVTDAGLEHLKGLTGLQELDLWKTQVTDAGLEHLQGLTGLQGLDLRYTQVTDAGLAHLKGLTGLQDLNLSYTKVTDAGLDHLKGLTGLQRLDLRYTQVTGAGLEHLKGLTGLQELDLWKTQVTDAGLEHLKGLTGLQDLNLRDTQVTDAGLAHLKGLTGLQKLDLCWTEVTGAGLAHLKGFAGLQALELGCTQVTDAGLAHLHGLTGLQWLSLRNTRVTDAGLAQLERALPHCKVVK